MPSDGIEPPLPLGESFTGSVPTLGYSAFFYCGGSFGVTWLRVTTDSTAAVNASISVICVTVKDNPKPIARASPACTSPIISAGSLPQTFPLLGFSIVIM